MHYYCILILFLVAGIPAHAESLKIIYDRWEKMRDPDTSGIAFADGIGFLAEHAGWPEEKTIRLRTEAAALTNPPPQAVMDKFCATAAPISGRGMLACANAGSGNGSQRLFWVKQGWLQGDFTDDEEKNILASYGRILGSADHIARAERLLYAGKITATRRMLPLVPTDRRKIYTVRLAFIGKDGRAPRLLAKLSASQQRDAGIIFERLRWRMSRGDAQSMAELLLATPDDVPYPDLWWPLRTFAARGAISRRNYAQALAVITRHGNLHGEELAEALWLKGWLLLRHHNDAASAYTHFLSLYTAVSTPVSKARAAYWAGRAAEKNGNREIATQWMEKAAEHVTVFYGQLARQWLTPDARLLLPAMPQPTDADRKRFAADELVQAAVALAKTRNTKMRDAFIAAYAARNADSPEQLALLTQLANDLGDASSAVEVAKLALRNGVVLVDTGWPRIALPENMRLEPSLALAITRQESEFNPTARSNVGARGLMQILPATARQTARKIGIHYKDSLLDDPALNLIMGSHYLSQIIDGFDGSYILGIASYNAGPGSVRRWIATMGKPPENLYDALDWIESIPFGETRNYVMRALENVSVYRTRLNPDAKLTISNDITGKRQ